MLECLVLAAKSAYLSLQIIPFLLIDTSLVFLGHYQSRMPLDIVVFHWRSFGPNLLMEVQVRSTVVLMSVIIMHGRIYLTWIDLTSFEFFDFHSQSFDLPPQLVRFLLR
jgi:hypothetical protein